MRGSGGGSGWVADLVAMLISVESEGEPDKAGLGRFSVVMASRLL